MQQQILQRLQHADVGRFVDIPNPIKGPFELSENGQGTEDEPDHVRIRSGEAGTDIYVGHGVDCAPDQVLWFAIRPEKITLTREKPAGDANITHGMVEDIAYLGDMSVFQVILDSGKRIRVTKANSLRGDPDGIKWDEPVWCQWGDTSGSVLVS